MPRFRPRRREGVRRRGPGQPAPDLSLEAAQRLRVPPQRWHVVEAPEERLAAARAAGMHAVAVRPYVISRW